MILWWYIAGCFSKGRRWNSCRCQLMWGWVGMKERIGLWNKRLKGERFHWAIEQRGDEMFNLVWCNENLEGRWNRVISQQSSNQVFVYDLDWTWPWACLCLSSVSCLRTLSFGIGFRMFGFGPVLSSICGFHVWFWSELLHVSFC